MLRHSSLQYVDNTSNAGEYEWVHRNQTAMECSENWAEYYGSTERTADSRHSYDFKVLFQECENIINLGLVASNNPYLQQKKEHGPEAAISGRVDLSVELDKLKIYSHEFPQGNSFQRHPSFPVPVLQSNDSVWALKNSSLHNVENTPKAEGYDWAQINLAEMDGPENWVNSDLICNGRTVSSNPYNFNELTQECKNLNSGSDSSDNVNVNELSSYFDDIVHIPKNMTEWADRMYT